MFQKEIYSGVPNVTEWRVLWKCLTIHRLYSFKCKRFRNTRYRVTFGTPLYSSISNTLHYQWKSHWTVTIPGKNWCVLLHYDSSKHCTCPLNNFIHAFKVVKPFLKQAVHDKTQLYQVTHLSPTELWGSKYSYIMSKLKSRYNWRSVSHYVKVSSPLWDLWPDITFCPKVVFWNLLFCLCGAPSLTRGRVCHLSFSV
jgi:hypothetical protein